MAEDNILNIDFDKLQEQIKNLEIAITMLSSNSEKGIELLKKRLEDIANINFGDIPKLMNEAQNSMINASKATNSLTAAEKQLQAAKERLAVSQSKEATETAKINEEIRKQNQLNREAARGTSVVTNSIDAQRQKVSSLREQWSKLDVNSDEFKQLNKELSEANSQLTEMEKNAGIFSRNVGNYPNSVSGLKEMITQFLAIGGAVELLKNASTIITDFEQANANLASIIGKSRNDIELLTNSAKKLGETTEFSASQVTELQTELAKLGFSEKEIINMQSSILQFSTALDANLGSAAEVAGASLRAFNLTASETGRVVSAMAVGANASALDFSDFETAMSTIAPVAKTFGFTIEDTVALLGTLANAGFDASTAATATRNILLNMADSSGKLAIALGKPVTSIEDLVNGLSQLNKTGIDLAGTLELTDKISVSAFNTFLEGSDSLLSLRKELDNTDGVLETIQKERLNTVEGRVKLLKSAWESLMLSFSSSTGIAKKLVNGLTAIINGVNSINISSTETKILIASLVGIWGTYTVALKGAAIAEKALALARSLNPWTAIATAATAAAIAIHQYSTSLSELKKSEIEFQNETKNSELNLKILWKQLVSAREGTDDYRKAKKQIIDQYGQYINGLIDEKGNITDLKKAYDQIVISIRSASAERIKNNLTSKATEDAIEKQVKLTEKLRNNLIKQTDSVTAEFIIDEILKAVESGKVREAIYSLRESFPSINFDSMIFNGFKGITNLEGISNELRRDFNSLNKEIDLISKTYDKFIINIKNSEEELSNSAESSSKKINKVLGTDKKQFEKSRKDEEQKSKETQKNILKNIQDSLKNSLISLETDKLQEIIKLTEDYNNKIIEKSKFEKESGELSLKYLRESLRLQIDVYGQLIKYQSTSTGVTEENLTEWNNKLAKAKLDLANSYKITTEEVQEETKSIEYNTDAYKKNIDGIINTSLSLQNETINIFSTLVEKQISDLDRLLEKYDEFTEQRKIQIDILYTDENATQEEIAQNEEKRTKLKAQLDLERLRVEQQIENQKRQIAIRQARFEKSNSISNIGWDTSQAIMNTWATVTPKAAAIALTALIAGIGAAQTAAVIATPIPAYEMGGILKKRDTILWGEKRPEVAITPSGETIVAKSPTIQTFDAGTEIFPSIKKYNDVIAKNKIENDFLSLKVLKQIASKQEPYVNVSIDENGLITRVLKKGDRNRYIDRVRKKIN